MEYLFVLGRNIELSRVELICFLDVNYKGFKILDNIKNAVLINIEEKIKERTIDRLGGTIFIGEVLTTFDCDNFEKKAGMINLYNGKKNKINYSLLNFESKYYDQISSYLKKRFKEERLKASEKKLGKILNLQDKETVSLPSSKNEEDYFLFKEKFGKIIQKCDYKSIEQRDMKKPFRRPELSISPRLAKIMINLSKVKENQTILDPFCGVGTILQEVLLQNINVIGVDIDKKAIKSAKQNLDYFNFNKKDYLLIWGDSSKLRIKNVNAIVTEPELGNLQRNLPNREESKRIIYNFERFIIKNLNNLKKYVTGRIVFTAPLIIQKKDKISCNFKDIEKETGLFLVKDFPIAEFRGDSYIGREIVVFEK